ncbi:hypothetical protein CMO91_02855 [Candidatus Woesearchaeota archaeon]|nr:hypothetical protein [Candidatus Woesearchaeota archaeon]
MCGIIGLFAPQAEKAIAKAVKAMHRGNDGEAMMKLHNGAIGHCLHAMTGNVKQPLKGKGVLVANCEIYNYKALGEGNDAQVLLEVLDKEGVRGLDKLDGVYAFAYITDDEVLLSRDYWGVKPLYYATKPFAFASEKKFLQGCKGIKALHPRQLLRYDGKTIRFEQRVAPKGEEGFVNAVLKRVPEQPFSVMLSGNDSFMIAKVLLDNNIKAKYYTVGLEGSKDIATAVEFAKANQLDHTIIQISPEVVKRTLPIVCDLAESSQPQEVESALITFLATAQAAKNECKAMLSGMGADEVLGSYERQQEGDTKKERLSFLRRLFDTNLYAQDVVSMVNGVEIRLPFLDAGFVSNCLTNATTKEALAEELGITLVKRSAPQYGSGISKVVKDKKKYQATYAPPNLKIAALLSGGKDSVHALDIMQGMGYEVGCAITLHSQNKDSFLYHTPNTHLVKLQAEAMKIPCIEQPTRGEPDAELDDLKTALVQAKKVHDIEGVVCGALFSQYQRDRMERVCEDLGLVLFAPLWHKPQEAQLIEVLDKGYEVVIVSTAADGLDKSWLGRPLTKEDIDKLKRVPGVNVAGEGGEYETLVVHAPFFDKRIEIGKTTIKEDKHTSLLVVEEASLS